MKSGNLLACWNKPSDDNIAQWKEWDGKTKPYPIFVLEDGRLYSYSDWLTKEKTGDVYLSGGISDE